VAVLQAHFFPISKLAEVVQARLALDPLCVPAVGNLRRADKHKSGMCETHCLGKFVDSG